MRLLKNALFVLVLLLVILPSSAHEVTEIYLIDAWAVATVNESDATPEAAVTNSAIYFTIENPAAHPIRLVSATSPAAETIEIREGETVISEGLIVPTLDSLSLSEDSAYLALADLTQDLIAGDAISLTLTFEMLEETGELSPDSEPLEVVVGVPVFSEAPVSHSVIAVASWARPTVAAMDMGDMMATPEMMMTNEPIMAISGAFMTLINRGETDLTLVSAESPVSDLVEVHETAMEGEMMRMREVEGGIALPAGEMVELRPGGYHIMLMELNQELVPGEAIMITLTFDDGSNISIAVPVYDPFGMPMMAPHG